MVLVWTPCKKIGGHNLRMVCTKGTARLALVSAASLRNPVNDAQL
jgi:hypothetical protein